MGASNGRDALHAGTCLSRGLWIRCVVIPCASVRQNPGRALRGWACSIVNSCAVSVCVSTSSLCSGASRTDSMAILLSSRMLPMRYGGCLLRSSQYRGTGAASGEGQSSIGVFSSLYISIRHHRAKEKLIVFMWIRKKRNEHE